MPATLYDLEPSGNCYKVRLLASLLGAPLEIVPVDFLGGAHKRPDFLRLNPFGELPVLEEDGLVLRDSQAILIYLARRHGGEAWLPSAARGEALVAQWLSTAANEVARGPNDARLHDKFGYALDVARARADADRLLAIMDAHLATRDWLALDRPTVADVACYPYLSVAHEGGVEVSGYVGVARWMERVRALPGYVGMPGQR